MEKVERDFKGIWIPKEIWLNPELSLMEKVLFVEVHSLDNERGCFASNRYFARFFRKSDRQIARDLASLASKGLITIEIKDHSQRTIRTAAKYVYANPESVRRLRRKVSDLSAGFSTKRTWRDNQEQTRGYDRNVMGGMT